MEAKPHRRLFLTIFTLFEKEKNNPLSYHHVLCNCVPGKKKEKPFFGTMRLLLVLAALTACAFSQTPVIQIDQTIVAWNTAVGISVPIGTALLYSAIIGISMMITSAAVSAASGPRGRIGVLGGGGMKEDIALEMPATGAKPMDVHGGPTTKRHEAQVRG